MELRTGRMGKNPTFNEKFPQLAGLRPFFSKEPTWSICFPYWSKIIYNWSHARTVDQPRTARSVLLCDSNTHALKFWKKFCFPFSKPSRVTGLLLFPLSLWGLSQTHRSTETKLVSYSGIGLRFMHAEKIYQQTPRCWLSSWRVWDLGVCSLVTHIFAFSNFFCFLSTNTYKDI